MAGLLLFQASITAAAPAILQGTVRLQSGRPAGGAFVRLTRDTWEITHTNADATGRFRLDIADPTGTFEVWSRKDTWGPARTSLRLSATETNGVELTLAEFNSLQGVLKAYDQSPLAAAIVQAVWTAPLDPPNSGDATLVWVPAADSAAARLNGLVGEFFPIPEGIRELSQIGVQAPPLFRRIDPALDFGTTFGGLADSGQDDNLFVRWSGSLRIERPGRYTFYLTCDDGGRVLIDGRPVVNNDGMHVGIERSGSIELSAGDHPIECLYFEATGAATCILSWAAAGIPKQRVPPDVLFHHPTVAPFRTPGLTGSPVFSVKSNSNGRFVFQYLPPGRYELRCLIPGGWHRWGTGSDFEVTEEHSSPEHEFQLAPFKKGRWRTYTAADGLVQDEVHRIGFAPDGTLWFATMGGVSHYDGNEFVNLTREDGLLDDRVYTLCGQADGSVWFGTASGACRYANGHFTYLTTTNGLTSGEVLGLAYSSTGELWIRTRNGLVRYDGTRVAAVPGIPEIASGAKNRPLALENDHTIWLVPSAAGGLWRQQGDQTTFLTSTNGLLQDQTDALLVDRKGYLWFGEYEWVVRYDGTNFLRLGQREGLVARDILAIHEAPDGSMWFGTRSDGAFHYDGRSFVNYTVQDGLAHNTVYDIRNGPNGTIWFATARGVSRFDRETFRYWTRADGLLGDEVRASLLDRQGALWFGAGTPGAADGGLCRFFDGSVAQYSKADVLLGYQIYDLFQDRDGLLWAANPTGGIMRYDGRQFAAFSPEQGLAGAIPLSVDQAQDGALWFGCLSDGLSRYDPRAASRGPDAFTRFTTSQAKVTAPIYRIRFDDEGTLWIGSMGNGVSCYDGAEFRRVPALDLMNRDVVRCIFKDRDGAMWFGTENGAVRYDKSRVDRFTSAKRRLVSPRVNSIYRDSGGALWFGTDGGVTRFDGALWSSLTLYDGLSGSVVRTILEHPQGALWFGTDKGVTRYEPRRDQPRSPLITVHANQEVYAPLEQAAVPLKHRVEFRFKVVDYTSRPENRLYRYQVFPGALDSDDVKPDLRLRSLTRATQVSWSTNKTGVYTFAVQFLDRESNVSEPALATVEIFLPWFRNRWILGPGIAANAGLLAVAIVSTARSRKRKRIAEALREQMLVQEQSARKAAEEARTQIEAERAKVEQLLGNILPRPIANRLKQGELTIVDSFAEVTVLFADLAGFTNWSLSLEPAAMVHLLNEVFSAFDALAERHGLEKIKTIGDAYMAVPGLPFPRPDHAEVSAQMALDMLETLRQLNGQRGTSLQMRIGLDTGPVVAGIIGRNKFSYDLWGDTVNTASRMESLGVSGKIQCTEATARCLMDRFRVEPRSLITVKGIGAMKTFFVLGRAHGSPTATCT